MNRAIHFKTALKAFTVFLLTAFLPTTAFSQADLKINEIKPWVGDGGTMDSLAAIIEIFNAGDSVQELTGWEIATDSNVITLPSWSLPALGYLQIQLIAGTNDSILNDGMGTYFTGNLAWELQSEHGEVGLFSGTPSPVTAIDFVAWGAETSTFGDAWSFSTTAGIWQDSAFVSMLDAGIADHIARFPSGYDRDSLSDWVAFRPRLDDIPGPNSLQLFPSNGNIIDTLDELRWRPVSGAIYYLVEVAFDSAFTSLHSSITSTDTFTSISITQDSTYYWRVTPTLYSGYSGGGVSGARFSFSYYDQTLIIGAPRVEKRLAVPLKIQHKDSPLLCLWEGQFDRHEPGRRNGCDETNAKNNGPWNSGHSSAASHVKKCKHCGNYCVRASIQMVNHYYGGTLTQDEISYHLREKDNPQMPGEDLGHGTGAIADENGTYGWALNGINPQKTQKAAAQAIPWNIVTASIDAGKPILASIPRHAVVITGYAIVNNIKSLYISNPWPGETGWVNHHLIGFHRWFILPAGNITGRKTDPNVTLDKDSDGVVNFDEQHPDPASGQTPRKFCSLWNKKDTDKDEVNDYEEIYSYTFHRHIHTTGHTDDEYNGLPVADGDGINLRAECDCDSDNDGHFDGGEDKNGNGKTPEAGETDVYTTADGDLSVETDKQIYTAGEDIMLDGKYFHSSSSYLYEIVCAQPCGDTSLACPTKADGDSLKADGWVTTNGNGIIVTKNIGPLPQGSYRVIVDAPRDSIYNCIGCGGCKDPSYCFKVVCPTITLILDDRDSCLGQGRILLSASGGNTPYTYSWSGPNSFSSTEKDIDSLDIGWYYVTVTDSLGCTAEDSVEITALPQVNVVVDITDSINCKGGTGALDVTATGGTQPFQSITWETNNGHSPMNVGNPSGLPAGQYIAIVTDANGCKGRDTTELYEPFFPFTLTIDSFKHTVCFGDSSGAIYTTYGGTPIPHTVTWTSDNGFTPPNTDDITGLPPGWYKIRVKDSWGCILEDSVEIKGPSYPLSVNFSHGDVKCYGDNDGYASASAFGGCFPYTYSWAGPNGFTSTSNFIDNLEPGWYHLTVTDTCGCVLQDSAQIENPPSPLMASAVATDVTCYGANDGSINLSANGGWRYNFNPPYSANWTGPNGYTSTTVDPTGLAPGWYHYTVRDAKLCEVKDSVEVKEPDSMAITFSASHIACHGDSTGTISISITGGTQPYVSFVWSGPNGFSPSSPGMNLIDLPAGWYTVTVTDANGCTVTDSVEIKQPFIPLNITFDFVQHVLCWGDGDGFISATVSGGCSPYQYSWTGASGFFTATTAVIDSLSGGWYVLTVSDTCGCSVTDSMEIQEPDTWLSAWATATHVTCFGDDNGTLDLSASGGTPPYSASWSGPNGFFTNEVDLDSLAPGWYHYTVTDAHFCSVSDSIKVNGPTAPLAVTFSSSNVSCFGGNDGSASITVTGGTEPYASFVWSGPVAVNPSMNIDNLVAGWYSVTVTDANGCTVTDSVEITEPAAPLTVSFPTVTHISCYGGNDGAITASASGGTMVYAYTWNGPGNPGPGASINGLVAGWYQVTVTDANGCTVTDSVEITGPSSTVSVSSSVTDISCFGFCDGEIDIMASGGNAPYSYSWSNGATSEDVNSLCWGQYVVTVTDANGCSATDTSMVTQPFSLYVNATASDVSSGGYCDGSVSVTLTGGNPPYSYAWSNGDSTNSISSLCAGTYSVTVTDSKGCSESDTATVNEPVVYGCMDTSAVNYDSTATVSDTSCLYDYYGCTDTAALNYDSLATVDDGSCYYDGNSSGCTMASACNYDPTATVDDGSCVYPGCTDASANNYDPSAGCSDGSCTYNIYGCTDTSAINYDPAATIDDTSCYYDVYGCMDTSAVNYDPTATIDDGSCTYSGTLGCTDPSANNYNPSATVDDSSCTYDVYGCTDPGAANYNPSATVDDTSCYYDVYGCMDTSAFNYDPAATIDDGSCTYSGTPGCTDAGACNYDASATTDDGSCYYLTAAISGSIAVDCPGDAYLDVFTSGGSGALSYSWSGPGFTSSDMSISGLESGTYSVTITDAAGCTTSVSETVVSDDNSVPVIYDCPEDMSSCSPVSAFLPPVAYDNCNLANFNRTVTTTPSFGGIVTTVDYVATDDEGNSAECNFTITQNPLPSANAGSDATINVGDTYPLGGASTALGGDGGPYSYIWYSTESMDDAATANPAANPTTPGDYSYLVFVIDGNGCAGTDEVIITVLDTAGSGSKNTYAGFDWKSTIALFPNPASDILNITANWGAEGAGFTVEMYDFFGRKVYSFDSNAKGEWSHKTNVTGLVSGLYEVRLISQKQVFVRKVIISR